MSLVVKYQYFCHPFFITKQCLCLYFSRWRLSVWPPSPSVHSASTVSAPRPTCRCTTRWSRTAPPPPPSWPSSGSAPCSLPSPSSWSVSWCQKTATARWTSQHPNAAWSVSPHPSPTLCTSWVWPTKERVSGGASAATSACRRSSPSAARWPPPSASVVQNAAAPEATRSKSDWKAKWTAPWWHWRSSTARAWFPRTCATWFQRTWRPGSRRAPWRCCISSVSCWCSCVPLSRRCCCCASADPSVVPFWSAAAAAVQTPAGSPLTPRPRPATTTSTSALRNWSCRRSALYAGRCPTTRRLDPTAEWMCGDSSAYCTVLYKHMLLSYCVNTLTTTGVLLF